MTLSPLRLLPLLAAALAATVAPAADPQRIAIIDNDWSIAGGAMAVMPLIANPGIKVIGLTAVIGDSYVPDSIAHTLRFLEIIHRGDIPMIAGANTPLIRTKPEFDIWQRQYGSLPYGGAWASPKPGETLPGPNDISPMKEGPTKLHVAPGVAATYLIEQAKAHAGELEILAAGPLTNLALAVRLDPGFAARVKRLVIMGGLVDANQLQITDDADFNTDFNFMIDPEAADIVLTAGFPRVEIVGVVSNSAKLTKAMVDTVASVKTPLTDYYKRNAWVGLPLWDELAAAVLADPKLITKSTQAYMRVNLDHGVDYGRAHVWPDSMRPKTGEGVVTIVDKVDLDRFYADFFKALQAPLRH